jgi:hypothetical protein
MTSLQTTTEKEAEKHDHHDHKHGHDHKEKHEHKKEDSEDKRMGRNIAFGLQQTLACWATDFIDPPISRWLQNKFGNKSHPVTHTHVWGGEIIGDTSAFFSFIAIKRFFKKPVDAVIGWVKSAFNGYFDRMGKRAIKDWADAHHVTEKDGRYQEKLESYKQFQAENTVDSVIVATSATLANVGIQRALGNKQGLGLILVSKIIGAVITMATMLGLRTALPTATKTLDDELSNRYFSPMVRFTQRMFGVKSKQSSVEFEIEGDEPHDSPGDTPVNASMVNVRTELDNAPIVDRPLAGERRQALLDSLQRNFMAQHGQDISKFKPFLEDQKKIFQAFVKVLYPQGRFAQQLGEEHYKALVEIHGESMKKTESVPTEEWKKAAMVAMQSIVLNRRDDMLANLKILDDKNFTHQLEQNIKANKKLPPADEYALTPERKEHYIESLVQTDSKSGHEPAVHIYANAKGQLIEHQALAKALDVNGNITRVLAEELTKYVGKDTTAIAKAYIDERHDLAHSVADVLTPGGEIVREAVKRSEQARIAMQSKNKNWQAHVASETPAHTVGMTT